MCNNCNTPDSFCVVLSYTWVLWLFYHAQKCKKSKIAPDPRLKDIVDEGQNSNCDITIRNNSEARGTMIFIVHLLFKFMLYFSF